ncbi:hypothetical protein [Sphingomonas sp. BAUL-RG-20F-R05-02]|uniref:hypothetical protein n=1 Tax=Sphingomonas sp. BAUL-RG-20F-R05-02 TaxID=2914830 RepID=UPI001F5667FB|nr:hypothetical protein [Sphingomonas sp. BAUL-RG-20F-R05-02]
MFPTYARMPLLPFVRATKFVALVPAVFLMPITTAAAPAAHSRPTMEQIGRLERLLVLPEGATGPLQRYNRYYAGTIQNGRRLISGELDYEIHNRRTTIKLVPQRLFPGRNLFDAGCDVIWVTFDPQANVFTDVTCQPEMKLPLPGSGH